MDQLGAISVEHELSAAEELTLRRAIHRAQRLRTPMLVFGSANAVLGVVTGVMEGVEYGLTAGLLTFLPWALLGGLWITLALVPFAFWGRHDRVNGRHARSLDETGLHIRAGDVAFDLPWYAMSRAVETPEFLLFFDAQSKPYYLPKRGLKEREQREVQRLLASRSPESLRRLGDSAVA